MTELFVPSILTSADSQGPTLCTWGTLQFGVYTRDVVGNVSCVKIDRATGVQTVVNLEDVAGNALDLPLDDLDGHQTPSIGVDSFGRVYVSANHWTTPNPPRIVKSQPDGNITGTWVAEGANLAGQTVGGEWPAYHNFVQFRNGGLGLLRRIRRALNGGGGNDPDNGTRSYLEYKAPGSNTWTASLFAEGPTGSQDAFYWCGNALDANDRLYVFGTWDRSISGTIYGPGSRNITNHSMLFTDDYGQTWNCYNKDTGATITNIPTPISRLGASGIQCRTGIDFGPLSTEPGNTQNLYVNSATVDGQGRPWGCLHCRGNENGYEQGLYIIRWDGDSWVLDDEWNDGAFPGNLLITRAGNVSLLTNSGTTHATRPNRLVMRSYTTFFGSTDEVIGHGVPGGFQPFVDQTQLAAGNVEVLMPDTAGTPHVYRKSAAATFA